MTLLFTTVMNELERGLIDEDEEGKSAPADRAYWEKRTSKTTITLVDEIIKFLKKIDIGLELKYNKPYIGIIKDSKAINFVTLRPAKQHIVFEIKAPLSEDTTSKIDAAGLDTLEYSSRWGRYRLRLTKQDIDSKPAVLLELAKEAYDRRVSS